MREARLLTIFSDRRGGVLQMSTSLRLQKFRTALFGEIAGTGSFGAACDQSIFSLHDGGPRFMKNSG